MTESNPLVLIVDADSSLREQLSSCLRTAGYRVEVASSGEEARVVLAQIHPAAVITDLNMQGLDGMGLFTEIHQRDPTLPVIILTAQGAIPDIAATTEKGVYGYFPKPVANDALLEQLASAVALGHGDNTRRQDEWRSGIISHSRVMDTVLEQARCAATSDVSILIQGETGTGKELLAQAIHRASERRQGPFVSINCSEVPEHLLESELFGQAKGAFTSATRARKGLLQEARGGTLFLDDIGDMPLPFQVKLLRALQVREARPVGSDTSLPVDVRIISAHHGNLQELIRQEKFHEGLFYRLSVIQLELPPLRERCDDIPVLANHFLHQFSERDTQAIKMFAPNAMEVLKCAPWPGNIRQLQNVVEQTLVLSSKRIISASCVVSALRDKPGELPSLCESRDRFEQDYLEQLLRMTDGNVTQAARIARRNRTEFYKLLHRHGLEPEQFRHRQRAKV